jgi:protein-disulfide isomerase
MFSFKLIKKEDKIKMGKTILKWCLYGSSVLLISCNTTQNASLEQAIKEISDNQKIILSKIESLEKGQNNLVRSVANIASAGPSKPAKNQQKQPDPNKVYNIEIGDSYTLGPDNAKVTIIEWMDFQ